MQRYTDARFYSGNPRALLAPLGYYTTVQKRTTARFYSGNRPLDIARRKPYTAGMHTLQDEPTTPDGQFELPTRLAAESGCTYTAALKFCRGVPQRQVAVDKLLVAAKALDLVEAVLRFRDTTDHNRRVWRERVATAAIERPREQRRKVERRIARLLEREQKRFAREAEKRARQAERLEARIVRHRGAAYLADLRARQKAAREAREAWETKRAEAATVSGGEDSVTYGTVSGGEDR